MATDPGGGQPLTCPVSAVRQLPWCTRLPVLDLVRVIRESAGMSSATVDPRWRVTVPPDVRAALGLAPGDDVVFTVADDGQATVVSRRSLIDALRGAGRGAGAVDDLLAVRRAESAREAAGGDGA